MKRAARAVERRMRLRLALDAACTHAAAALVVLAPIVALAKLGRAPAWLVRDAGIAGAISVAVAVALAATRRLAPLAGARRLDRHHGLAGRLSSALSFAALPEGSLSPFMRLAMDDAAAHAGGLAPRAALPLRAPRDLGAAALLACGVLAIGALEIRTRRAPPPQPTLDAPDLAAEDVELFRDVARELGKDAKTPEIAAAVAELNQLVDDLASKRLDRAEAFRRLADLEDKLKRAQAADAKALEEALKERARALRPSALAKPLADALDAPDLAKAEKEMRELAKRLRSGKGAPSKAELEKLRDAMKKASAGQKERLAALDQRREELREELLRRRGEKKDGGAGDEEEERLLKKRERELERLDREAERESAAQRRLDRLDRELSQAAEDILRELGDAAKDLEQGAEDIHRMAEEQMSEEQREELLRRMEDLRDQLRQGGQEAKDRLQRMRRFSQRARGGQQGGGQGHRSCPPGDPDCKPQEDDGSPGGEGEGGDGGTQQEMTMGEGGEPMLVLRKGSRPGSGGNPSGGGGAGQGKGEHGSQPGSPGGKDWGEGHDPNVAGAKPTDSDMSTEDVQAAGLDTGQGASRSQTIYGAAERGFRGGAYKRVYSEYRTSAEKSLEHDQIPPGASGHVRRYFDLIRPRE